MTIQKRLENARFQRDHSKYLWKGTWGAVAEVLDNAIRNHDSKKDVYKRLIKMAGGPKVYGEPACIYVIRHEAEEIRQEIIKNTKGQKELSF